MYQFSYADMIDDDPVIARERERHAFDQAIRLLERAEANGPHSADAREAMFFVDQFWMILMEDLVSDGNDLPERLRAGLISIGIWILKEINRVRTGQLQSFQSLIDVNITIRDGLN